MQRRRLLGYFTTSRYAEARANPTGPGNAHPTAIQFIKDEGVNGKLAGKVIVITGTSSGIGIKTARALLLTGAKLFLTAYEHLVLSAISTEVVKWYFSPGSAFSNPGIRDNVSRHKNRKLSTIYY
ncbi:hypothetical protein F5883DRAFT_518223 [Diaporthe sp. PMI_573]|nr:hypothetical protein F5883DRAFT_518223 [Diaporthaceae sp. PMI_573]